MTQEHPVSRIAQLIYDRQDSTDALATELRISPDQVAQWLVTGLAPRTRLLMKGFAAHKAAALQQRARQLIETADSL